ncbi:MAG: SoxR reducing system RseC family protein [Treponema sp.]|nr:SoxR reducing system RseC family protein [Treponema sp.]
MTEKGMVREIRGNLVIISPLKNETCFGCMNMECKNSGLISAENPNAIKIEKGQMVEVEARSISIFFEALIALLPPFLFLTLGFILTRIYFPEAGEGAAAFIGIILLFAAAFIIYIIRKKHPAKRIFLIKKSVLS